MKIVEEKEFFDIFHNAMTYQEWVATFEKQENVDRIKTQYNSSSYLKEVILNQLEELEYNIHLLVIVADWCGDCIRNAPIIQYFNEHERITVKFLKKEDNLDLIKKTNGGERIPFVMVYSLDGFYISDWAEKSYEYYMLVSEAQKKFNYKKDKEYFEYARGIIQSKNKELNTATAFELINTIKKANAIQLSSPRINQSS